MITSKKIKDLQTRCEKINLKSSDYIEKYILGSGKGGQKKNKTASCVYIKHIQTGIEVNAQASRSREINRFMAKRKLVELLEEIHLGIKSKSTLQAEKIKKQKDRRQRRQKRNPS